MCRTSSGLVNPVYVGLRAAVFLRLFAIEQCTSLGAHGSPASVGAGYDAYRRESPGHSVQV